MGKTFGLKLKDAWGDFKWLYTWSEYSSFSPAKPLSFSSIAEAEDYAQAHEIPSFLIEPITEDRNENGPRLLNG